MALRAFAGGALFAEGFGDGRPKVLALHGWGRRGSDFRQSLNGLGALAVDLPGFGASPAPSEALGAEGYAALIVPLLDEFESPPVVVGHSFGGRVAVCLAASHPERVGPLIVTGSPLVRLTSGRKPSPAYRLIRSLNRMGLVSDMRMEEIRRSHGSADYRAASGVMRDILVRVVNESYESQLRALQSPVDLIWGNDDRDVPVAIAEAASREISQSGGVVRLEILDGVGHLVPIQAPEALRRVVDRALQP